MAKSARKSGNRATLRQGLVDEPLTLDQLHKLAALDDILTFLVLGRESTWERWPRRTSKVDLGTIEHAVDILTATREDLRQTLQELKEDTAESLGNGIPPVLHARLFDCWTSNLAQKALIAIPTPTPADIQAHPFSHITFTVQAQFTVKTKTGKELLGWDQLVVYAAEGIGRQDLVDSGLDAEYLIKTEKGGGWKLCLGPGTLFRKACNHCFTVSSMDQRTPAFTASSILTWQVDKSVELFRQGGASVGFEDCPEPQHAYNVKHYSAPSQSQYARPLALIPNWDENEPEPSLLPLSSLKKSKRKTVPPSDSKSPSPSTASSTGGRSCLPLRDVDDVCSDGENDAQAGQASANTSDVSSTTRPSTTILHATTNMTQPPNSVSRSGSRHQDNSFFGSGSSDKASRPKNKIRKLAPISLHSDVSAVPPTPVSPALTVSPIISSAKKRKRGHIPNGRSTQSVKPKTSVFHTKSERPQPVPQQYDDFDDSIEVDDALAIAPSMDDRTADTGADASNSDGSDGHVTESLQPERQDGIDTPETDTASARTVEEEGSGHIVRATQEAVSEQKVHMPEISGTSVPSPSPFFPARDMSTTSLAVPCVRCSELSSTASFALQQLHSSYQRSLREQRNQFMLESSALCTSLKSATDNLHLHRTSEERARRLYLAHDAAIAERDEALRLRQEATVRLSQVIHERDSVAADRAEAHRQLQAMMLESSKLQQVKDCLTVELDQAVTELQGAKAGMGDLGAGRAYLEAERDSWAARVSELEREKVEVVKEKKDVMVRLECARKEVGVANEQLRKEKESSEELRRKLQELLEAKKELLEANKSLELEKDGLASEKEKLNLELRQTQTELEEAVQSMETAEQKNSAMSKVVDELSQTQEDGRTAMMQMTSERDEAMKEKEEAVKEMEEAFRTNLAELLAAKNNEEAALKEAETLRRRLAEVLAERQSLILASRARSASKTANTIDTDQVDKAADKFEALRRQMEAIGYARDAAMKEKDRLMERRAKDADIHKKELESRDSRLRRLEGRLAELDKPELLGSEKIINATALIGTPPRRHQPLSDPDSITRSPTATELADHAAIKRRIKQQGIEIRALRNANKVLQSRNDSTAQSSEDIMSVTQNIERRNVELQARMEDIVRAVVGPRCMSDGSVSVVPVSYNLAVQMNRVADISLRGAGVVLPEKERSQGRSVRGTASSPALLDRVREQQNHSRVQQSSQPRSLPAGLPVSAARISTGSLKQDSSVPHVPRILKSSYEAVPYYGNASSRSKTTKRRSVVCTSGLRDVQAGDELGDDQTDCEGEIGEGNGSEASILPSPLADGENNVLGKAMVRRDREPYQVPEGEQGDRQEVKDIADQRWRGLPAIRLPSLGIFR